MKLGARILKTGIAIVLAIYICRFLGLPSPAFAGIAAVFAVQPSIYRTYQSILEQIQGNVIGAVIAFLLVLTLGNDPVVIGIACIIVISINLKLNIETAIPLALVTVIAIMESPDKNLIEFASYRFVTIMVGVFSSFLINLIFLPPKHETKLYHTIFDCTQDIMQWIRVSTLNVTEYTVLKQDLDRIKETLMKIDQTYLLYKEERQYLKRNQQVKGRKLVVLRKMISTTNIAYNLIKKIHRAENDFHSLPDDFRNVIVEALESNLAYHEQLLLKYAGKIRLRADSPVIDFDEAVFTASFMSYFQNEDIINNQILILISTILDYNEQLVHLDTLIESFQTYHRDTNEVNIEESN